MSLGKSALFKASTHGWTRSHSKHNSKIAKIPMYLYRQIGYCYLHKEILRNSDICTASLLTAFLMHTLVNYQASTAVVAQCTAISTAVILSCSAQIAKLVENREFRYMQITFREIWVGKRFAQISYIATATREHVATTSHKAVGVAARPTGVLKLLCPDLRMFGYPYPWFC